MENIGNKPGFVLIGSVSVKKGEEKFKKKILRMKVWRKEINFLRCMLTTLEVLKFYFVSFFCHESVV